MSSSSDNPDQSQRAESSKRTSFKLFGAEISLLPNDSQQHSGAGAGVGEGEVRAAKRLAGEPVGSPALQGNGVFVFIRMLTGKRVGISVNEDDTVGSLLSRIATENGIPKDEHVLIYGSRVLDEGKRIEEYGIGRDSTINVGRKLRSIEHMEMWRVLDRMVNSSIELCGGETDRKLDSSIRKDMERFLRRIKNDSEELGIKYLNLFTSLSAANALSMLYLSPSKQNQELGAQVIGLFFAAVKDFDTKLQVYAAASVLQICKRLRTKDPRDAVYCDCRRTLSSIVSAVFDLDSGHEFESMVTWQEVFPFVIEMGDKVRDELTASLASPTLVTPTLVDVQEFHSFLSAVLKCILDTVNLEEPIIMPDGVLEHPSCEQLQSLHSLFVQLLNRMYMCFHRADLELSRRECGDGILDGVGDAYLLLLKALDDISKIFYDAAENLWRLVESKKVTMRVLITKYAVQNADDIEYIDWLLEHKQVLDFNCRTHMARMLFPQISDDHDHEILIDRSRLFVDSFRRISHANPESLRTGFSIKFRNEEATGPGVLREWFILVCKEVFTTQNALFLTSTNDRRRFYINPASKIEPRHLDYFKFCGRVIALALMYEVQIGILLDNVLFVQLAGLEVHLEDIKDADPTFYQSCTKILEMDADLVDSDALGLTFVIEYEEFGSRQVVELYPGGESLRVTSTNREEYIQKLINHRFQASTSSQLEHFCKGFEDIMLDPKYLPWFFRCTMLEDLDCMLCGSESDISVEDWKAHTDYKYYKESDRQIIWFWKIVGEMSPEDRRRLLFFWTAIKYLPVEGFSGIDSRLEIRKVAETTDHLPTSSTCFNLLCLPKYPTYEMMKQRIAVIVQEHVASSFGIS